MTETASTIFRDYEIPAVPASGAHKPVKREIVAWGTWLETLLQAGGAGLAYATKSALTGDLAQPAHTTAIVYADSSAANNGIYVKSGSSGTGSWTWIGDLAGGVVKLTVTGGTANAIVAESAAPPSLPGNKLYLLTPEDDNTGATTIIVDGAAPVAIKSALGSSLVVGSLLEDSTVLMAWVVDHYRLMISVPVDASGILNDALDARNDAEGFKTAAEASASALGNQVHQYDTLVLAEAATIPSGVKLVHVFGTTNPGDGISDTYKKVVSEPSHDEKFQSADNAWWEKVPAVQFDATIDDIEDRRLSSDQLIIRPVGFSVVDPLATSWKRISEPDVAQPWHKQSADGQWWEIADHVAHPFMFGNVGKGGDDSQAFQDCVSFIARDASELTAAHIEIPAGVYEIDQVDVTGITAILRYFKISGFGVQIKPRSGGTTNGFLMRLKDLGPGVGAQMKVEGIYFDQASTTGHINGLIIQNSPDVLVHRCYFAGGGNVNARPIFLRQGDVSDSATGNFWVTIDNCWIRKNGSLDISYGILSEGANNHMIVQNTKITTGAGTACLIQTNNAGVAYSANSVQFLRNAIEGNTYGVHFATPPGQNPFGFRGIGNRFESTDYPWRFTLDSGSLAANAQPPLLAENIYLGELGAVTNTAGAVIQFKDQRNLSGSATINNGNTGTSIAFPIVELSTNYNVAVGGADGTLYVTNKSTSGFDIIRTGSSGSLAVRWTVLPGEY